MDVIPVVGMGATWAVGTDRYPYRVVRVSEDGKRVWVKQVECKRIDQRGPYTENQEYDYGYIIEGTPEREFSLRSDGHWIEKGEDRKSGCPLYLGYMNAYRDPSF